MTRPKNKNRPALNRRNPPPPTALASKAEAPIASPVSTPEVTPASAQETLAKVVGEPPKEPDVIEQAEQQNAVDARVAAQAQMEAAENAANAIALKKYNEFCEREKIAVQCLVTFLEGDPMPRFRKVIRQL